MTQTNVSFAIHNMDLDTISSSSSSSSFIQTNPPPMTTEPQDAFNSILTIVNMANSIGPSVMLSTPAMETLIIDATNNSELQEIIETSLNNSTQQLERNEDNILYIEKLMYKNTDKTETECSICCGEFKDDEFVSITPCKHYFHNKCIMEWGYYNTTCPVCRGDIPIVDKKENDELE